MSKSVAKKVVPMKAADAAEAQPRSQQSDKVSDWKMDTLFVHGQSKSTPRSFQGEPTLPPITFSTAFGYPDAQSMEAVFAGQKPGSLYSRLQNPTVQALEERLTAVCHARGTLALASGMSAETMGILAVCRQGDDILVSHSLFSGTHTLFQHTLRDCGITPISYHATQPETLQQALTSKTKAVFVETISNPGIRTANFQALRQFCDQHELLLLADSTLTPPGSIDWKSLGIDIAFLSGSKYLAGPASQIAGMVIDTGRQSWRNPTRWGLQEHQEAREFALLDKLRSRLMASVGPCLSPFNAFIILVGLETLPLRWKKTCQNAEHIAAFLQQHPAVKTVHYPSIVQHPDHQLCQQQFQDFGGVLSFELESLQACRETLEKLKLVILAPNLGDTRTIAVHPASSIYGGLWPQEREDLGVNECMIRLSVGIEDQQDIQQDLQQALPSA